MAGEVDSLKPTGWNKEKPRTDTLGVRVLVGMGPEGRGREP